MNYELGVIAHSCSVKHARKLQRHHAQLVNELGIIASLEKTFPLPAVNLKYVIARDGQVAL